MWFAKAIAGAVLAGIASAGTALEAHGKITAPDIGAILISFVAGFNGVYWAPKNTTREK
jgi:hypothetical protein